MFHRLLPSASRDAFLVPTQNNFDRASRRAFDSILWVSHKTFANHKKCLIWTKIWFFLCLDLHLLIILSKYLMFSLELQLLLIILVNYLLQAFFIVQHSMNMISHFFQWTVGISEIRTIWAQYNQNISTVSIQKNEGDLTDLHLLVRGNNLALRHCKYRLRPGIVVQSLKEKK